MECSKDHFDELNFETDSDPYHQEHVIISQTYAYRKDVACLGFVSLQFSLYRSTGVLRHHDSFLVDCCTSTFFFFFVFCLFMAAPMAYGGSQARGPIGAIAAGLCHSHSNTGSESHL